MTPLPLGKLYTRGIRFITGRVHSASMLPEVMAVIADGRIRPAAVPITRRDWATAADTYLDEAVKLVIVR